jgi:hypothetical protein
LEIEFCVEVAKVLSEVQRAENCGGFGMTPAKRFVLLVVAMAICVTGCGVRKPHEEMGAFVDKSYIDLEPGWRVRVVTPVLRSGKFKMRPKEFHADGKTVALQTGGDFLGYETDYYAVSAQNGDGVVVRFGSAEFTSNGKSSKRSQPLVPLFDLPENVRYVRLLFLTRVSQTEHDQAILGSPSLADLDALRKRVEDSPSENCKPQPEGICSWVPPGIAVQPEKRIPASGKKWIPAT